MALEIYWTQEAIDSFNKIIDYLETNWTEREVNGFMDTFKRKLSLLEKDNVLFKNSIKRGYREILITKHNWLIYRVRNNKLELILLWDTRQNPKKKRI
ncbi:MAG: type II toxin-antitoxin system RelE/ParE family toxin [Bacteroidia bacterium]|jgi:plasmid stabilization system protein ParE